MSDETDEPQKPGSGQDATEIGAQEPGKGEVPFTDFEQDAQASKAAAAGHEHRHNEDHGRSAADLEAVFDIPVNIAAVLGRTNIEVSDLLQLDAGDVVELDRKVGEAIDIFVNNRLVARGEVVLVEERLGVTMTEIIKSDRNA